MNPYLTVVPVVAAKNVKPYQNASKIAGRSFFRTSKLFPAFSLIAVKSIPKLSSLVNEASSKLNRHGKGILEGPFLFSTSSTCTLFPTSEVSCNFLSQVKELVLD